MHYRGFYAPVAANVANDHPLIGGSLRVVYRLLRTLRVSLDTRSREDFEPFEKMRILF